MGLGQDQCHSILGIHTIYSLCFSQKKTYSLYKKRDNSRFNNINVNCLCLIVFLVCWLPHCLQFTHMHAVEEREPSATSLT